MNKALRIVVPLLLLAAGILVAVILIATGPEVQKEEPERKPPIVETVVVDRQDVTLKVRSQGTVEPRTSTVLAAEVGGRITEVSPSFQEGGFFEKGEVLLRIDPRDYEAAVARARSELAQARVALRKEEAQAELAREEYEDIGAGDPSPLALRLPQLEEARAAVSSARGTLTKARADLSRTVVEAPYAGRVVEKRAELGQYVGSGTALAEVYSTDVAEIRLPVERRALSKLPIDLPVRPGQALNIPVQLEADLGNGTRIVPATIVRAGPRIDPASRMLDLFAQVPDPFEREGDHDRPPLVMGLYVEASIQGRQVEDAFVIPADALRDVDQVYVVRDGRLAFVTVEVLERTTERAVVRNLEDGARVVVSMVTAPVEGMAVRTEATAEPEVARGREEQ